MAKRNDRVIKMKFVADHVEEDAEVSTRFALCQ